MQKFFWLKLITKELDNFDFISVLADGSTDKSNEEQEMIYICMLKALNL